ncbi:hypothetical protein G6F56_012504 [Rhizopus delemar]|nr:hypothetical protein G6F56_012504 [Rhizopus delemar]
MGAKRAVSGRSQAYDILLAAYQKKTIGRPTGQEPLPKKKVIINEAPIQTASTPVNPEKSLKHLKKLQSQVRLSALSSNESNIIRNRFQNNTASTIREEGYVDSDEEIESVMQAIQSIKPSPLAEKPYFFVKRRRQCFRIRNTLLDAITPKSSIAIDNPPLRHNHTLQNLRN